MTTPISSVYSNFSNHSVNTTTRASLRSLNKVTKTEFLHGDVEIKKKYLSYLLSDEIRIGFLMLFCELQHSTENIKFVIAANQYRNYFKNDGNKWKPWKELDKHSGSWEQKHIDENAEREILKLLEKLSDEFLSNHSKYEICISELIKERTNKRIKNFKVYGPEVFKEASVDPINTLVVDILPRFIISSTYEDMEYFMKKIDQLPSLDTINFTFKKPPKIYYTSLEFKLHTEQDIIEFCKDELSDYFIDPLLHSYFLKYLTRIVAQENLIFISEVKKFNKMFEFFTVNGGYKDDNGRRLIGTAIQKIGLFTRKELYEEPIIDDADLDTATPAQLKAAIIQQAWKIFLFFLAPGSVYEVGTSHKAYQSVCRNLAVPIKDMFSEIESSAMIIVTKEFDSFINTSEYSELLVAVKERQIASSDTKTSMITFTSEEKKNDNQHHENNAWNGCVSFVADSKCGCTPYAAIVPSK